jgi:hypothetical protein
MATLTSEQRNALPDSAFVFPDKREYPIQDIEHGRNALSRGSQNETGARLAKIRSAVYGKYPALKKSEDVELEFDLWKSDEHHLVYGVVLEPNLHDSQGDRINPDEIRKAAHRYLEESRESDVQHAVEKADGVSLVESAMAPHDMVIGGKPVTGGSWFAAYKVRNPEVWSKVEKGELTGFSMGGSGLRLPEESAVQQVMALGKTEGPEVDRALEKADLTNVVVNRVSLVDRAAVRDPANPTQPRTFLLYKRESAPKGDPVSTIDKSALSPEVREALEKAEQDAADAQAARDTAEQVAKDERTAREKAEGELAKAKEAETDDDKDDKPVNKADLPPEARAALEKAEADREAMAQRLEKAEKNAKDASDLAKAEHDRRITREYIAKAETGELRGLPGQPAEVGPLMKSLAEAAPEAWAEFEKNVLTPAAAQITQSELFKEQGRSGEGPPPESALAKMNEKVEELRKSDSSLTRTQALEKARTENPELAKQLHDELRSVPAS